MPPIIPREHNPLLPVPVSYYTPMNDIIVNPILHRRSIFTAVRDSHPQECLNRYIHYDPRRERS